MFSDSNVLATRRAASGIYSVLASEAAGGEVVVPVNVCYAAVYPIVYARCRPVFCDVDAATGNVTAASVSEKLTPRTKAVLIPHMYGHPVRDFAEIAAACRRRGVLVIEDCASAMGATLGDRPVGRFGDYAVFSTGHAKIVDAGGGGFVLSRRDLRAVAEVYRQLPEDNAAGLALEAEFSKVYRRFLNTRTSLSCFEDRDFFRRDFRKAFLMGGPPPHGARLPDFVRERLDGEVARRRAVQECFEALFRARVPSCACYRVPPGGVPWRFSFFVPPSLRQQVADALLAERLPVSDWYPPVNELFGDTGDYPRARQMGKSILNLPLSLDESDFIRACSAIGGICHE